MSHGGPSISGKGVSVGIALPVILGLVITFGQSLYWEYPEGLGHWERQGQWLLSLLLIGTTPGLLIGIVMAYHGAVIAAADDPAAQAPAWGIVVGLLCGISLGGIMGFTAGLLCGQIIPGTLFGLYFGPFAGVLSWEAAYWVPTMESGRES